MSGPLIVRLRGLSQMVSHPLREQPEIFEYWPLGAGCGLEPNPGCAPLWRRTKVGGSGRRPLRLVMGSGDELRLTFSSSDVPPLQAKWRTDFLLFVDGWAKDADANTAFSQTVEPLPFHSMTRYPYPAAEHYPDDAWHRAYRETYNTRPAIRFVPPLLAGARS